MKGVLHFHHYLYGRHILIRTDHAALRWLLSFRHPEGQLARWIGRLQEYDFVIQYRPGAQHANADALSRRPCLHTSCRSCDRQETRERDVCQRERAPVEPPPSADILRDIPGEAPVSQPIARGVQAQQEVTSDSATTPEDSQTLEEWTPEYLRRAQMEDPDIQAVIVWKESGNSKPAWNEVSPHSESTKTYWAQWDSLELPLSALGETLWGLCDLAVAGTTIFAGGNPQTATLDTDSRAFRGFQDTGSSEGTFLLEPLPSGHA